MRHRASGNSYSPFDEHCAAPRTQVNVNVVVTRDRIVSPCYAPRVETLKGTCVCGAVGWTFDGDPGEVTACNCTSCRRRGTLMIYDFEGERVNVFGQLSAFKRSDLGEPPGLEMLFCPTCACIVGWRGLDVKDGRRRMAVNIRLCDPQLVSQLPIRSFDGLDTWTDRELDGRHVRDLWC